MRRGSLELCLAPLPWRLSDPMAYVAFSMSMFLGAARRDNADASIIRCVELDIAEIESRSNTK